MTLSHFLLSAVLATFTMSIYADIPPSSATKSAPLPPSLPPIPPLQQKEKDKSTEEYKPTKPVERKQVKLSPVYFHPGVLIFKNGTWNGGDYLFNLSNQIGVYVNIIQPENSEINVDENAIRKKVENAFSQGGITPTIIVSEGEPPVPFFQMQILVYPAGNVVAASTKGALYEAVTLKRAILEQGTSFQAITWQRESLIVSSPQDFEVNLLKNVDETVNSFVERYQFYRQFQPK